MLDWGTSTGFVYASPKNAIVPLQLGSNQRFVRCMALDGEYLYWANNERGEIMRLRLPNGAPEVVVANQGRPFSIALDATTIYWSTGSEIRRWRSDRLSA